MGRDNSWLSKRGRGIHLTIRDIDCKDYDAEKMSKDFYEMGVSFFSFFAGGYVTTYPSKLKYSRKSPWLGEQDITGDIVRTAHKYGIKAIAMADLSVLSPEIAQEHPEWLSIDINGKPYESNSGMYTACVMSNYAEYYGRDMVTEILDSYDVDAMKFGGGSYGFHGNICYCENCRKDYESMFHEELPLKQDWDDSHWRRYHHWRTIKTSERCRYLRDMVQSIQPDMPVMGNGVCFGSVDWTSNSALDIEDMANYQDMIQVEAQDRVKVSTEMDTVWQSITWTGEEACYMTSVTDKPIWVVVSYFKAWPWRRAAVDYAEQKAYMAQIMANGATPMINLAGGPPIVHEDKRGFKAPTELFTYLKNNSEYYDGDRSGANIALVYSQDTLIYYGKSKKTERYLEGFRGIEKALRESHIPFDIISTKVLDHKHLEKYKALVLPTLACMCEETAQALRAYVEIGGSLVATFETGLYNASGEKRNDFVIGDLLKVKYSGKTLNVNGEKPESKQNYCRLQGKHQLLEGIEDTELIPIAGKYCEVESDEGTQVPLTLAHPFIIFPEGLSYTTEPDLDHPMMIAYEHESGGRTVYLPNQLDRLHWVSGCSDLSQLFANAVKWAVNNSIPATCEGPNTIYMTLRTQEERAMVHLVNLTGGERYFKQFIPLYGINVKIKKTMCKNVVKAFMLSDRNMLNIKEEGEFYSVIVPELKDYDVLVFEG